MKRALSMSEAMVAALTSAGTLILGYLGQAVIKRWTDRQTARDQRAEDDRNNQPGVITAQTATWTAIVKELQDRVDAQHERLKVVEAERDSFEQRLREMRMYYEQRLTAMDSQHTAERGRDKARIKELEARVEELEAKLAATTRPDTERTRAGDHERTDQ